MDHLSGSLSNRMMTIPVILNDTGVYMDSTTSETPVSFHNTVQHWTVVTYAALSFSILSNTGLIFFFIIATCRSIGGRYCSSQWIIVNISISHLVVCALALVSKAVFSKDKFYGIFEIKDICGVLISMRYASDLTVSLSVTVLAWYVFFAVYIPSALVGPKQFVFWNMMSFLSWVVSFVTFVPITRKFFILVSNEEHGLTVNYCTRTEWLPEYDLILFVVVKAIPYVIVFGLACLCVIGTCALQQPVHGVSMGDSPQKVDSWRIWSARRSSTIFLMTLWLCGFLARFPGHVVNMGYRTGWITLPTEAEHYVNITYGLQLLAYLYIGLFPFLCLIWREIKYL